MEIVDDFTTRRKEFLASAIEWQTPQKISLIDYESPDFVEWRSKLSESDQNLLSHDFSAEQLSALSEGDLERRSELLKRWHHEKLLTILKERRAKIISEDVTRELSFEELAKILEITIKNDIPSKVITFNAMLLAQTEDSQINVGYQSDSSTGKTWIALEVAKYFPQSEIIALSVASPTAFFHDRGIFDSEKKATIIDLEGKTLIFLDQQHFTLLSRLRPLLSHDMKELRLKITDKSKSGGNRTKDVIIRGFCSVIYCSANLRTDEQEQTRLILLSAESDEEKLRESLKLTCERESNKKEYVLKIESDADRAWLKNRIIAVRERGIKSINVPDSTELVLRQFFEDHKHLRPRLQRDLPRIFAFIKASALLNCFNRNEVDDETIEANESDIKHGYDLYRKIELSNELGLAPAVLDFFNKVIKPIANEEGSLHKDIKKQYFQAYHKTLTRNTLIALLEQLESTGLVREEPDPDDKRKMRVFNEEYVITMGGTCKEESSKDQEVHTPNQYNISLELEERTPNHFHISDQSKEVERS